MIDNDLMAVIREELLVRHVGRENAITVENLLWVVWPDDWRWETSEGKPRQVHNRDDRQVRQSIERLIDGDFPVCSVTETPAGYFFPADVEEARTYTVSLRSRAAKIFLRRRHIVRNTARWYERARQLGMRMKA